MAANPAGPDRFFPARIPGLEHHPAGGGRHSNQGKSESFTKNDTAIVNEALAVTHLTALSGRQINALSGGQQQRAFLARAYAQQSHVCLLDEPFAGLDTNSQKDLREILRNLAGQGKLLLVSHHDLNRLPICSTRVVMLNRELVACREVSATFTSPNIARTYSTSVAVAIAV